MFRSGTLDNKQTCIDRNYMVRAGNYVKQLNWHTESLVYFDWKLDKLQHVRFLSQLQINNYKGRGNCDDVHIFYPFDVVTITNKLKVFW